MSYKLKLVAFILMLVLAIPIFRSATGQNGAVKGAFEDGTVAESGQLASGAIEVRNNQDGQNSQNQTEVLSGKVIWQDDIKVQAKSDKFSIGSTVAITSGNKKVSVVIGDTQAMTEGVVMIVDKDTFQDLGGNIDTDNFIQVEVVKE